MKDHLNVQVVSFLFTHRCCGRDLIEEFTAADIFYLSFQCATILFQKVFFPSLEIYQPYAISK
jgi:hypothetical protein